MRLLNATVVLVWPEIDALDDDGNRVRMPGTTPQRVNATVYPLSSSDASSGDGQLTTAQYRLLARTWPAGPHTRVTWDGRTWDVVGEPERHHGASAATRHVSVLLRPSSHQT